jgi:hypothetical protein
MAKSFKTLQFVKEVIYDGKLLYQKGQIVDVDNSLGYADKWIRRGCALTVEEKPKQEVKPPQKSGKHPSKNSDSGTPDL